MQSKNRELKRVMHEVRLRKLTVKQIKNLSSSLRRITFTGDDLAGFVSLSPDDHIKVFFPYPGESEPIIPTFGPNGPEVPKGSRPALMRDYTPRRYDKDANELDIEFFIHGDGPGSQWAQRAQIGQNLTIGGPRGSMVVPYEFDWYLMIGDETFLPAIQRRLEELPANSNAIVVVEVENESQRIDLQSTNRTTVHWVYRNGRSLGSPEGLKTAVLSLNFPVGDFFSWIAAEKSCAMEIRDTLVSVKGATQAWTKATGYWQL